jgi:diacylglycerol kinase family enzyme
VITADGVAQWAGTVGRTIAGHPERSPNFHLTRGRKVKVKLDRKVLYELDGGTRAKVKSYRLAVEPAAITVCVPAESRNGDGTA